MVKTVTPPVRPENPQCALIDLKALQHVQHSDDIVEYLLCCIAAMTPRLEAGILDAAEQHVRAQFGGERVYVGRRRGQGMVERNAEIRRLHQRGERVAFIARKFGLTRQRVAQILGS